jgi:hypothetical protein
LWLSGQPQADSADPAIRWFTAKSFGEIRASYARRGDFDLTVEAAGHLTDRNTFEAAIDPADARSVQVGALALATDTLRGRVMAPPVIEWGIAHVRCHFDQALASDPRAVRIVTGRVSGIAIPPEALVRRGEVEEVVIVRRQLADGDVELERRRVTLEPNVTNNETVVTHGLSDGERVVLTNASWLAEQI